MFRLASHLAPRQTRDRRRLPPVHKRPRRWVSLDVEYLRRPRIIVLRRAFGPAGPLAFLALILECDRTERGQATNTVEAHYDALAELVCATPDEVRGIVELAASLKLLAIDRERDGVTRREHDRVTLLEREHWAPQASHAPRPTRDQPRRIPTNERVLAALRAADRPLSRFEIAEALGLLDTGSFRERIKRLRDTGLIELSGRAYSIPKGD